MFDLVKLSLLAGDGGNGKVSFRREKFIPKGGPDGGVGGDGGNVYIRGSKHFNTLQHFSGAKEYKAEKGQDGGKQHQIGHKGESITLEVPVGTTIWLLAENRASRIRRVHTPREGQAKPVILCEKYYLDKPSGNPPYREPDEAHLPKELEVSEEQREDLEQLIVRSDSLKNLNTHDLKKVKVAEITEDGQEVLVCAGGLGGRGNDTFKSSTNTTPFEAEYGTFGERKVILLELKLLADVGLVGYPNAGKSTFLSIVTKANPKIGNYPFTTLEPNLGVMSLSDLNVGSGTQEVVLADIPGIIEGASEGKGLGFDFLRHVQACKVLMFILSLEEQMIFDESQSTEEKAKYLYDQFVTLQNELNKYDPAMSQKPWFVAISKEDVYSDDLKEAIASYFQKHKLEPLFFSAVTKNGVHELKQKIAQFV